VLLALTLTKLDPSFVLFAPPDGTQLLDQEAARIVTLGRRSLWVGPAPLQLAPLCVPLANILLLARFWDVRIARPDNLHQLLLLPAQFYVLRASTRLLALLLAARPAWPVSMPLQATLLASTA